MMGILFFLQGKSDIGISAEVFVDCFSQRVDGVGSTISYCTELSFNEIYFYYIILSFFLGETIL